MDPALTGVGDDAALTGVGDVVSEAAETSPRRTGARVGHLSTLSGAEFAQRRREYLESPDPWQSKKDRIAAAVGAAG